MSNLPRHLNLSGASNFRDLGGYLGRDGRLTRWRRLFRSNHLGHLTDADIEALRTLGLKSAFDLRGAEERLPAMCNFDGIAVHSLPIEPVILPALEARLATGKPLLSDETQEIMRESYRDYVRHHTGNFRTLFKHIVEDDMPMVIHCTAGKDRTGFACALFLKSLGVADDVIVEDYLLTSQYYRRSQLLTSGRLPEEVVAVLSTVDQSYLVAAMDAVRSEYGGFDAYFENGLGLGQRERAALDQRYLEV